MAHTRIKFLNWKRVHLRLRIAGGTLRLSSGDMRWNRTIRICVRRIEKRARKNQSFCMVVAWNSSRGNFEAK